ncbi:type II toxin-antitoxin system HicB family antitoxin [Nostoc sp. CHAB 5836]|nr:type II toxin-antitoxin system HicB family antitoxin [Nostoc sp. CHAB 5836]
MNLTIEISDMLTYGQTREEGVARVKALVLGVFADKQRTSELLTVSGKPHFYFSLLAGERL